MATHDYVIANQSGAAFRTDLNNALAAIVSNNSNSSSPSTTYAYQWWADTTNGILKIRNSANNAWVELLQLDGTLTLEDGAVGTPALAFRDDLDTGIFSSAANTFNVATGGVERMELGATTIFNEDGADVDFRIEGDTDANLFYVDAGNDTVGIGTSSPSSKLEIRAATATHQIVSINRENSDTAALFLGCNASNNAIIASNNTDLLIGRDVGNSFTERLRMTNDGAVGIGCTPSRTLHVNSGATNAAMRLESTDGIVELEFKDTFGTSSIAAANDLRFNTLSTTRMKIDSSGNIGAPSGTNIFNASDSRVKKNVETLDKGLAEINSLRPVSFNWVDSFCDEEKDKLYGFIAQEVQALDTNLIQNFSSELTLNTGTENETKISDILRVNEKFIIPMLVKAIQELSTKVTALEAA